jgi:signal transduction histidine kinase
MFTKAALKLTLFYSTFFFCFFWLFSIGVYLWMEKSIGEGMIVQQVQQQEQRGQFEGQFDERSVTIAGTIALDQLKTILLVLNVGLLPVIPLAAWFLTRRTLAPVRAIHEQQQQFASDVSHALRTPLAILSGEIEVALKKDRSKEDYQHTLKSAAEESVVVVGQEAQLRQLFINIIDNAMNYTSENGKITIELSKDTSYGIVKIKDTGVGIAPEQQARIFDRFYRVDAARSETKGYGLGLAIAQAIVAIHNGKIRVHSALGKGTTFSLYLPLA